MKRFHTCPERAQVLVSEAADGLQGKLLLLPLYWSYYANRPRAISRLRHFSTQVLEELHTDTILNRENEYTRKGQRTPVSSAAMPALLSAAPLQRECRRLLSLPLTPQARRSPSALGLVPTFPADAAKGQGSAGEGLPSPTAQSGGGDRGSGWAPRPRDTALFPTARRCQAPPYRRETLRSRCRWLQSEPSLPTSPTPTGRA